jgi:nicotinate-nucleotide adenylyltransferase
MLVLATQGERRMSVSTLELDRVEKRYTVDTLGEIVSRWPHAEIFFVMGADSWQEIGTWREWEKVLLMTNHIVVARPGYEISFDHVTDAARERVVDLRTVPGGVALQDDRSLRIYITDVVGLDISSTEIRADVSEDDRLDREHDVPDEVAKYIEKYELYK